MAADAQRVWYPPPGSDASSLFLYNSLTNEKVPFAPNQGPNSKSISWYTCGPTVYDSAHLGHARNYVSFDVVRRVLEDYFGYNCLFVMNVTDVDDKIIKRARQNYLLQQYKQRETTPSTVLSKAQGAASAAARKQKVKYEKTVMESKKEGLNKKQRDDFEKAVKDEQFKLEQLEVIQQQLSGLQQGGGNMTVEPIYHAAEDLIAESLDEELRETVTDQHIFRQHAAKYEREFFEDLDMLGCRRPDVVTRVSEFVPEVIAYVQRIIDNGLAYEAGGSVYFDIRKFRDAGHEYGKNKPWAVESALLACESEANFDSADKHYHMDFALWKASKPGEPFWDSPWGRGRPGWHIECSAMASAVIGSRMDIHSGGEDLKFPHHDNELAQAEAYYHSEGCQQWVNYFLHVGHLHIDGLKMSKSLKNFVTIKEALKTLTPRQLRLCFALQPWHKTMLYEASGKEVRAKEAVLRNFFQNIDAATRNVDTTDAVSRWEVEEFSLNRSISEAQACVHSAFCDNINTPAAMDAVYALIRAVNIYLATRAGTAPPASDPGGGQGGGGRAPALHPQPLLLGKAAAFVGRTLAVMGILPSHGDLTTWPKEGAAEGGGAEAPALNAKLLDTFAAFRDEVRSLARSKAALSDILSACDRVRDGPLVDLGVRLEDRADGKAVWKLDDPAVMREEQAARAAAAAEAARRKLEGLQERKARELHKFEQIAALAPPAVALADKYSAFDAASGEPTHDKDGNALEGKAKDKARKEWEKAVKIREPLAAKLEADPDFLRTLRSEVEDLKTQLAAMTVT